MVAKMIKPRCKMPNTEAAEPDSARWHCRTKRCTVSRRRATDKEGELRGRSSGHRCSVDREGAERSGSHRGSQGSWRCVAVTPSYDSFLALAEGTPVDWTTKTRGALPDVGRLVAAAETLLGGRKLTVALRARRR